MNYKSNRRYFTVSDMPFYVGLITAVAGALFFFLYYSTYFLPFIVYRIMYFAMFPLVIAGIGIIIYSRFGRSSDETIDETVALREKGLGDDIWEAPATERKKLRSIQPLSTGSYDLAPRDGLLIRQGKDGKWRSTFYTAVRVMCTTDNVIVCSRQFSLTDDTDRLDSVTLSFDELASVSVGEIVSCPVEGGPEVKSGELIFNSENKSVLCRVPAHVSADVDSFVNQLNSYITKRVVK